MKNRMLLLLLIVLGTTFSTQAQKAFRKGNILLSPAVGLGSNHGFKHNGYNRLAPSFFFSADFGFHDYLSAGP